jgi:hypothetical protein
MSQLWRPGVAPGGCQKSQVRIVPGVYPANGRREWAQPSRRDQPGAERAGRRGSRRLADQATKPMTASPAMKSVKIVA